MIVSKALMTAAPTEYPFWFFLPERFSYEAVLEMVAELYRDIIENEDLGRPPELGFLTHCAMFEFLRESLARTILRGDYDQDPDRIFGPDPAQLVAMYEESGLAIGQFLEEVAGEFQMFSINEVYQRNFYRDLRYALNAMGLVYFDTPHHSEYKERGRDIFKFTRIVDDMVNGVLTEVW